MDATPHVVESTLLILAMFLAGCVIGYLMRRSVSRREKVRAINALSGKQDSLPED